MTYEEMKAAKTEKKPLKEKAVEFLESEECQKIKNGFKDGIFYAVGYAIGRSTGNKAIKLITDYITEKDA